MIDQQILSWISKGYQFKISQHASPLKGFSASIIKPNYDRRCRTCLGPNNNTWGNCGHGFTVPEAIRNELDRMAGKYRTIYSTDDFRGS